jgi:hypothetical protein
LGGRERERERERERAFQTSYGDRLDPFLPQKQNIFILLKKKKKKLVAWLYREGKRDTSFDDISKPTLFVTMLSTLLFCTCESLFYFYIYMYALRALGADSQPFFLF